tara:strand:+ start:1580 stop:2326 length:747 start_codon:yes stop_codon:yes gene_type:complete
MPFYYVAIAPKLYFTKIQTYFLSQQELLTQLNNIKAENILLQTKQLKYNTVKLENKRLKELLNSSKYLDEKFLVSEILDISIDPLGKKFIINKGSNDGVYVGQSVVSSKGVVGQIIEVNKFTSVVILITDADHAIPLENQRTGMRTLAIGLGASQNLELLNVIKDADIKEGDILISSGLGERFPEGYPVGEVLSIVYQNKKATLQVFLKPIVDFNTLKEVLLVWNVKEDLKNSFVNDNKNKAENKSKG